MSLIDFGYSRGTTLWPESCGRYWAKDAPQGKKSKITCEYVQVFKMSQRCHHLEPHFQGPIFPSHQILSRYPVEAKLYVNNTNVQCTFQTENVKSCSQPRNHNPSGDAPSHAPNFKTPPIMPMPHVHIQMLDLISSPSFPSPGIIRSQRRNVGRTVAST